jgi:hypothetical protein
MWKVAIIESERGWGQKIDEVREFESYEDAKRFQVDFNKDNTELVVPDWYMAAQNPVFDSTIPDKAIMNK